MEYNRHGGSGYYSAEPYAREYEDPYGRDYEDSYERQRKRNRSPSIEGYGTDAYGRAPMPYDHRERDRAAEWDRYYREQERHGNYEYPDRYDPRPRYDEHQSRRRAHDDVAPPPPAAPQQHQAANAAPDPMQSSELLPFRVFAQMQRDAHPSSHDRSVEPLQSQEIYAAYQTYKTAFNSKILAHFFQDRKHEAWFKERYSDEQPWLAARQERRRIGRKGRKEAWLQELRDGKLDKVNNDIQSEASGSRDPNDLTLITRHGDVKTFLGGMAVVPPCPHQIFIKGYPATASRFKLEELLESKKGFQYLSLGEPSVVKGWERAGWAMYAPESDMDATLNALQGANVDGSILNMNCSAKAGSSRLRTVPEYANSFTRLLIDIKQTKELVSRFEAEDRDLLFPDQTADWLDTSASDAILDRHRIIQPDLQPQDLEQDAADLTDEKQREERRTWLKRHLDLHLDLLRTVYQFDYYASMQCDFDEELTRRSPGRSRKQPAVEEPRESTNDESWAKSLDLKTALLLTTDANDLVELGGKSAESELLEAALTYVKQEDAEKHRCTLTIPNTADDGSPGVQCGKLFKAAKFVQKHILNKHRSLLLLEAGVQERLDEVPLFNNYLKDACRPTHQPIPVVGHAATGKYNAGGRMGMIRFGDSTAPAPAALGMRLGGVVTENAALAEPLPPPPVPLDPRASRSVKTSYQDLDGATAEGDVDLVY